MVTDTLGLSAALVALGVLLLNLNLNSNWTWWIKAGAIIVTSGFFVTAYFSLHGMMGWPTSQTPPEQFLLLAADVREPGKRDDAEGQILIWAKPFGAREVSPRAYRLPYSAELHQLVDAAVREMRRGRAQAGEVLNSAGGVQGGNSDRHAGRVIRFRPPPRPMLPRKRAE